jgi:methyl-accepting chemotaxis protein
MKNLSLRAKIGFTFGVILVMMVSLSYYGYSSIGDLDNASKLVSDHDQKTILALQVGLAEENVTNATRSFLLTGKESTLAEADEAKSEFNSSLAALDMTMVRPEHATQLAEIHSQIDQITRIQNSAVQYRRDNNLAKADEILFGSASEQLSVGLRRNINDLISTQDSGRHVALQAQEAIQARSRLITILLGVFGFLFAASVAVTFSRTLVFHVTRILGLINEIAANNLDVPDLSVTAADEVGHATQALNRMKNNLAEILRTIATSTQWLASASEQISSTAAEQTNGAESQRDQTQQVASAMQQMASTVIQISENSTRASEISRKASSTAHEGGKIVEETLTKMRGIAASVGETARKVEALGKSSDQIGQIVGVIDDIADQTNLLALNAAIEAARAGEQGRGFAVVADEVRKLAERTGKATKEIAAMIQNIQAETRSAVEAMESGTKQVEAGVATTTQAGSALRDIIQAAEQAGEMITRIAAAATEQSAATEEVNANVEQIARITAETAEGAQQSAKACRDLSTLALELQNIIKQFKLSSNGAAAKARISSPRGTAPGDFSPRSLIPPRPDFYSQLGSGNHEESEHVLTHG